MVKKQFNHTARKRRALLLLKVSLLVGLVAVAKYFIHFFGLEVVHMSPLLTSLVTSDVFLMGFLLNGVLQDYKESEKLPGELASAFETLALEIRGIPVATPEAEVTDELIAVVSFCGQLSAWLKGNRKTTDLMEGYYVLHDNVLSASSWLEHSSLRARLLFESANILRVTNRIHVVRETAFLPIIYLLAYVVTGLLCLGLALMQTDHVGETIFLNSVILFTFLFLLALIADLDNPFAINDPNSVEDVSVCVLDEAHSRLLSIVNSNEASRLTSPISTL